MSQSRKGLRNGQIVNLKGHVRTSGAKLTTDGSGLASILDTFLRWEPQAPRAGLCRLLRDEVGEALKEEKAHRGAVHQPGRRLARAAVP